MNTHVEISITREKMNETRQLKVNGKTFFTETLEGNRYAHQAGALAPVLYQLMLLTGDKKAESSGNAGCNGCNLLNPVRHTGFKAFNFKQKLFYVLFKKLFLSGKATKVGEVVCFHIYNNHYMATRRELRFKQKYYGQIH